MPNQNRSLLGNNRKLRFIVITIGIFITTIACSIMVNSQPIVATIVTKVSTAETNIFEVFANKGWQSTGIYIEKGDLTRVGYLSGLWFTSEGDGGGHDASGNPNPWICSSSGCHEPVHDFPKYALIGKIQNSDNILRIGNYLEFVAESSGILLLRPNYGDSDIEVFNPEGSIKVRIII
jgi:hypothetical protein